MSNLLLPIAPIVTAKTQAAPLVQSSHIAGMIIYSRLTKAIICFSCLSPARTGEQIKLKDAILGTPLDIVKIYVELRIVKPTTLFAILLKSF